MDAVKYKEINLLNYWISAFFLIQILVFYAIRPTRFYVEVLKYEVILFYFWCFISMFGKLKFMSLYFLFLFSFGLFILSRLFLDILGEAKFEYADMFFKQYFSLHTQKVILSYILFFLISVHAGATAFTGNKPAAESARTIKPNARLEKFGLRLFWIYLPIVLAKIWIQFSFVLEHGYLAIFSGEMENIDFPFWMAGASSIFDLAFVCILIAIPARKKFISIALIYLFIQLFSSLIGGRGKFILSVLFVLWYYYKVFDLKFKIKNILYLLTFVVIFSQSVSAIRVKDEKLLQNNPLYSFFYEQGNSVLVLGHMVNYKDEFVNTGPPYIWGGLNFRSGQNTIEHLKRTNSLASELTYFLSPRSYLEGYGIGSSILGELYDLGILGMLIIAFALGSLIICFDKQVLRNPVLFFFSMLIVQQILWMPRGNLFPEYKRILVFIGIFIIIKIFKIEEPSGPSSATAVENQEQHITNTP